MKPFGKPIPGQSLTNTPKNFPWERPPEISDPEEAIQMHLSRLSEPDTLQSLLDVLEMDQMDVSTVTKGILRGAVAKGIHSIDVALIVAPVIHEFVKRAAEANGIQVEDGLEDKKAKEDQQKARDVAFAKKIIRGMGKDKKPVVVQEESQAAPMPEPKAPAKGLMSRGEM